MNIPAYRYCAKREHPAYPAVNSLPTLAAMQGYVEVKKSFTWAPRRATMADGVLTLEPIEGKSIFGNEVRSVPVRRMLERRIAKKLLFVLLV